MEAIFCWKFSWFFFLDVLQDEENGDIDWEPLERILGGFGPDCLSGF